MMLLTRTQTVVAWLAQLTVAVILLQTLFFKFTGAEESVYIFTTVGAEPWGRIGSGVIELIASVLLLVPAVAPIGAALAMASMAGAILTHLTVLGIEVKGDGGLLFALALTAFAGSAIVLLVRRAQIPLVGRYFELA
jgi:putative oxidoreductase